MLCIWTGIHRQTVWPGFEEPEEPYGIRGRVSSTGGKMLRWSQWALLPTAVCPENVYSWFDPVKLAKVLTGIYESAGFPGLEELFSPHAANGYLVMHLPRAFLMSPLHSLTLKMWILMPYMPYFWHYGSPHYAFLRWCRPSWKMAPCVNRTHFRRCHHAVSWPPHRNDWF